MSIVEISAPRRKLIQHQHQQVRDPNYWARRRAWWREHKQRTGCDWPGIAKTILEVDAWLDGPRRRS